MKPTVGRIVHYYDSITPGPQAAIIIGLVNGGVHNDVVLAVLSPMQRVEGEGDRFVSNVVPVLRKEAGWAQNGTDVATHGDYWTWPPREG